MKEKSIWTKPFIVFLAAFICCFLWGSASPAIKIGYRLFAIGAEDTPSRVLFAGVRFTLAGLMVIVFLSVRRKKPALPQKGNWKYVFALMTFQTILQYVFFYMGLAHTSGVHGSIINAAGTFFSLFLAAFVFHFEKLNLSKIAGSILGFLGVLCIVTAGASAGSGVTLQGEGAMTLAAFCSAVAGCLIKKYSAHEDPAVLSGWQFFFGGMLMAYAGYLLGGRLLPADSRAWILLVYMAFISAGAYTLWSILLKYNDVSRISILGFMNPVLGVLLSAFFLHEESQAFSLRTLAALILVSLGIIVSGRKEKQ